MFVIKIVSFILESNSKLKQGLPDECQLACSCAVTMFEDVCKNIQKGDIPMEEMQKIKQKSSQMKRLCEAVSLPGDEKRKQNMSFTDIDCVVEQRMQEFKVFEEYKGQLCQLCSHIPDTVQGKDMNSKIKAIVKNKFWPLHQKRCELCVGVGKRPAPTL